MVTHPDTDDVVIKRSGSSADVYVLGSPSAPAELLVRTREKAVSKALAFAKRQGVRAWFANGNDAFTLLGTFRKEENRGGHPDAADA
jgi:hypothetical protein